MHRTIAGATQTRENVLKSASLDRDDSFHGHLSHVPCLTSLLCVTMTNLRHNEADGRYRAYAAASRHAQFMEWRICMGMECGSNVY
jgi:hypothetical protein